MLFVSAAPSANFLNCESNRYLLPVRSKNVTPSILLRVQPRLPHHNERQRCDIINPAMGRWALYCCIMKLVSCVIRFSLQPDVCQVTRSCTANISVITRHSELTCVRWSPANQRPELAQSDQSEESVRWRKEVADSDQDTAHAGSGSGSGHDPFLTGVTTWSLEASDSLASCNVCLMRHLQLIKLNSDSAFSPGNP